MIEMFYSMLTVLLQPVLEAVGGVWQWAIFYAGKLFNFSISFHPRHSYSNSTPPPPTPSAY